jgi:predicted nucleotidyltransferase
VDAFALTPAERALFRALHDRGVRFLIVGLGAAVLEGAPLATQDLDVWLESRDERLAEAARAAGGFWVSGFGVQPPAFGGEGFERLDVVLTAHGLESFDSEYAGSVEREIDGIPVKVLPLRRVIASKRATNRPKDRAALPALEATLAAQQLRRDDE